MDVLAWLLIAALLVATVAGYLYPPTRPYVVRYWWMFVVAGGLALVFVLFRRRGGNPIDDTLEEGQSLAESNTEALDKLIDHAAEQVNRADAELARKRVDSWADRAMFDQKLKVVDSIDDSYERRKALIKLVESTQ